MQTLVYSMLLIVNMMVQVLGKEDTDAIIFIYYSISLSSEYYQLMMLESTYINGLICFEYHNIQTVKII